MREAGYLNQLQQLIYHPEESVQITSLVALGNLALNKDNSKNMKVLPPYAVVFNLIFIYVYTFGLQETIPLLLTLMKMMDSDEIIYNCLSTLTNIAVFHMWHNEMQSSIHYLYVLLESENNKIVLQCLKLLINLSCNDNMIPHLLGGQVYYLLLTIISNCLLAVRWFYMVSVYVLFQAPKKLLSMLNLNENEDILLRVVTLFSNLTDAVKAMELDPVIDLPVQDKAPAPDTL